MKKLMWYVYFILIATMATIKVMYVCILKGGLTFIILPALTGQPAFSLAERELSSPACL